MLFLLPESEMDFGSVSVLGRASQAAKRRRGKAWLVGELAYQDKYKLSGYTLSLSFISSRVHSILHRLRTRGWLLSQRTKRMLALTTPWLYYACLVFNYMPAYLQLKIQRLANAGIRFIYNLWSESIMPYRLELDWITFASRRLYFLGCISLQYNITHVQTDPTVRLIVANFQECTKVSSPKQ